MGTTTTPDRRPARIRIRQMPGETNAAFRARVNAIQLSYQGKSIQFSGGLFGDSRPQTVVLRKDATPPVCRCCACRKPLANCECAGSAYDPDPFSHSTRENRTSGGNPTEQAYYDAADADGEYEASVEGQMEMAGVDEVEARR